MGNVAVESHFLILVWRREEEQFVSMFPAFKKKKNVGSEFIFIEKKKLETPEVKQIGRFICLFIYFTSRGASY